MHASYRLVGGRSAHIFTLRLDNATDQLYRNHPNFIKDHTPELGRSVRAVYSVRF